MADRCKYQKLQYQVSYNNGSTWENVTPIQVMKGDVIEYMSRDCSEIQTLYRWVDLEGVYLCDGNNKYTKQIQEESYDNGVSWYTSYPTVYQQGTFVGIDASYCCDKFIGHYTAPQYALDSNCPKYYIWNGFQCIYIDPLKVVKCNGSNILTSDETRYYERDYELVSAEIGSSVTSIGDYAFNRCSGLTSIDIPDSVINIGIASFGYCSGLTSVTIGIGLTSIGVSAFYQCTSLRTIDIPNSVTSIGIDAFYNCSGLTSVTVNATTPPTLGTRAFDGDIMYPHSYPIYVPCESLNTYKTSANWSNYADRIVGIPPCGIPPIEGTKFIARYNDNTTYSAACDSITTLGPSEIKNTTSPYTAMTSCTIGECVLGIGSSAFASCSGLTSIDIPNGVTSIGDRAFRYCSGLTSIEIPSGVTSIGNQTFYDCIGLTSCTIGSGVTSIGNSAFNNCRSLTSIDIPNSVTSISTTVFAFCTSLTSVTIPDSVTSIGGQAFISCTNLTSLNIPSGVTSIGLETFTDCTSLASIVIPDSITSIGDEAFMRCSGMTSCTIGSGVTTIGESAFTRCLSLTSITVEATTPPTLGSDVFTYTNNCPIYVPAASVEAYKIKNKWRDYKTRIQAIP